MRRIVLEQDRCSDGRPIESLERPGCTAWWFLSVLLMCFVVHSVKYEDPQALGGLASALDVRQHNTGGVSALDTGVASVCLARDALPHLTFTAAFCVHSYKLKKSEPTHFFLLILFKHMTKDTLWTKVLIIGLIKSLNFRFPLNLHPDCTFKSFHKNGICCKLQMMGQFHTLLISPLVSFTAGRPNTFVHVHVFTFHAEGYRSKISGSIHSGADINSINSSCFPWELWHLFPRPLPYFHLPLAPSFALLPPYWTWLSVLFCALSSLE